VKARVLKLAQQILKHFIARMEPNVIILRVNHVGIHLAVTRYQHFAKQMSGNAKYVFVFMLLKKIYYNNLQWIYFLRIIIGGIKFFNFYCEHNIKIFSPH
jgi:hypothetical protein